MGGFALSSFLSSSSSLRRLNLGVEAVEDRPDSGTSGTLAPPGRPSALPMPSYSPFLANGDDAGLRYPCDALHPALAVWTSQHIHGEDFQQHRCPRDPPPQDATTPQPSIVTPQNTAACG